MLLWQNVLTPTPKYTPRHIFYYRQPLKSRKPSEEDMLYTSLSFLIFFPIHSSYYWDTFAKCLRESEEIIKINWRVTFYLQGAKGYS